MAVRDEVYEVRGKVTGIFTGGIDAGIFCGALILGSIGEIAGFTALFLCAGLIVLSGLGLFRLAPLK
jgi:predicted MFS family arabinose efflux permease